ncbi:MAG: hypothetical protein HQL54_02145 [Magnetococcales bacterium]|nr:hypothetical protein [Magnetococcales bacterium]
MNAFATELLLWVKGPGFTIAVIILMLGLSIRLMEIFGMKAPDKLVYSQSNRQSGSGVQTIFRRFLIPKGMLSRAPGIYLAGILFHIGYAVVFFLFEPHIALLNNLTGLNWQGLPNSVIDFVAVMTLFSMIVVLVCRMGRRAMRFLSDLEDYLVWLLTFLPLLTGFVAFRHVLLPYTWALALHLLSVELLMIAIPFTKLMHTVTAFSSRWYNGDIYSRKGVMS